MSRPDSNEHWNPKMPVAGRQEQQEDQEQQERSNPASPRPTPEEFTVIRDSVVLKSMKALLERSLEDIGRSSLVLKKLYMAATRHMLDRVSAELFALQREMKKRGMKMAGEEQADDVLYYRFICRGYEDRFGIMREALRVELGNRLGAMVSELQAGINKKTETD